MRLFMKNISSPGALSEPVPLIRVNCQGNFYQVFHKKGKILAIWRNQPEPNQLRIHGYLIFIVGERKMRNK